MTIIIDVMLTGVMSSLFHREEGQEGEEGPVDPQPPARERDRSHSKTKKVRRERRHADRGAETTASATPPTATLQPRTGAESQTEVKTGVANDKSQGSARAVRDEKLISCHLLPAGVGAGGGPLRGARVRVSCRQ